MNKDIVDRLRETKDPLCLEAANKIIAMRDRGKFWEKECKKLRVKYFILLSNRIAK
jgi:hypothetical protein